MPIPAASRVVAKILGLVNQKDVAREKIVRVMWKPRKPRRGEDPTKIYWVDTPELRSICISTTGRTSRSNARCINIQSCTALPASEQDTWVLDAEINDHGVLIDAPLAAAASRLAAQALADLNERMRQETDGAVDTATKNEKLKVWPASQGVKLPRKQRKGKSGLQWKASLDADDIEQLLAGDSAERARACSARDQVASGTIGGQQNRPDVADPLRRRAGPRTVQVPRRDHRAMVRRWFSTTKLEAARAAEDRRSDR